MRALRASMLLGMVLLSVSAVGCDRLWDKELVASWCKDHPQDADCLREFPDAGPARCSSNASCMAPTSVCDLAGTMMCVQCIAPDQAMACGGTTPTCGSDNACHACSKHDDCGSSACLADGSCAMMTDVAYVDPVNGTGTACSQAVPCKKVMDALGTGRRYVKLTGMIDEQVTINNQNVIVLAAPGTVLTRSSPGTVLRVDGSSVVQIFDLTIANGLGPGGIGITLPSGMASLDMQRVTVMNNAGGGITATGGIVSVSQSTITGNPGGGITTTGGTLTIARSTVSLNLGGGISIGGVGATFDITNTFIFRNGDENASTFGGLSLSFAMPGTNRLAFNTIVDNKAATGSAGVFCSAAGFQAPNNIVARNALAGSTTATGAQTAGGTYPTSKVQADIVGLAFVDPEAPAPFNYHLTATSSAIDQATTPVPIDVDFDGDVRPQGPQKDIGADEYKP